MGEPGLLPSAAKSVTPESTMFLKKQGPMGGSCMLHPCFTTAWSKKLISFSQFPHLKMKITLPGEDRREINGKTHASA